MQIIEETYIKINIWCRPIAKTRYKVTEIHSRPLPKDRRGTAMIMAEMRQKEKSRHETPDKAPQRAPEDKAHKEYTSALSVFSESYAGFDHAEEAEVPLVSESINEAPQEESTPRLKRLRTRISEALFDFSEIEQGEIEDRVNELVNSDGYYNEVEPEDADVEYASSRTINKSVILLAMLLAAFLAFYGIRFSHMF